MDPSGSRSRGGYERATPGSGSLGQSVERAARRRGSGGVIPSAAAEGYWADVVVLSVDVVGVERRLPSCGPRP